MQPTGTQCARGVYSHREQYMRQLVCVLDYRLSLFALAVVPRTCRYIPTMTRASRTRSRRRTIKKMLSSSSLDRKNWDESARVSLMNLRDGDVVHHTPPSSALTTPCASPSASTDYKYVESTQATGENQGDAGSEMTSDFVTKDAGKSAELSCELHDPDGHYQDSLEPSQQQNAKRAVRRRLRIDSKNIQASPLKPVQRPEILDE